MLEHFRPYRMHAVLIKGAAHLLQRCTSTPSSDSLSLNWDWSGQPEMLTPALDAGRPLERWWRWAESSQTTDGQVTEHCLRPAAFAALDIELGQWGACWSHDSFRAQACSRAAEQLAASTLFLFRRRADAVDAAGRWTLAHVGSLLSLCAVARDIVREDPITR